MRDLRIELIACVLGLVAIGCGGRTPDGSKPPAAEASDEPEHTDGAGGSRSMPERSSSSGGRAGSDIGTSVAGAQNGGTSGAPADEPPRTEDVAAACAAYCDSYTSICAESGLGSAEFCTTTCVDGLARAKPACIDGKLEILPCIARAMERAADNCVEALSVAAAECGNSTGAVDACHESACEEMLYGDGMACHAKSVCDNGTAELDCYESRTGGPWCTCAINGEQVFEIATGFAHSKEACMDEDLPALCKSLLP